MPIRSATPIGTLKELDDLGLSREEWGSCSARDEHRNLGCNSYEICPWRSRPHNKGWQLLKDTSNGPAERTGWSPCYDALKMKATVELNGGSLTFIAKEGEKVTLRAAMVKARDPLKPLVLTVEDEEWDEVVPAFPPASSRKELRHAKALIAARERRQHEIENSQQDKILGLKPITVEDDAPGSEATEPVPLGQRGGRKG